MARVARARRPLLAARAVAPARRRGAARHSPARGDARRRTSGAEPVARAGARGTRRAAAAARRVRTPAAAVPARARSARAAGQRRQHRLSRPGRGGGSACPPGGAGDPRPGQPGRRRPGRRRGRRLRAVRVSTRAATFDVSARRGRGAVRADAARPRRQRGRPHRRRRDRRPRPDRGGRPGRDRDARSPATSISRPRWRGTAASTSTLGGTTAAPSLRVAARFPRWRRPARARANLTLAAWMPDLRPFRKRGRRRGRLGRDVGGAATAGADTRGARRGPDGHAARRDRGAGAVARRS